MLSPRCRAVVRVSAGPLVGHQDLLADRPGKDVGEDLMCLVDIMWFGMQGVLMEEDVQSVAILGRPGVGDYRPSGEWSGWHRRPNYVVSRRVSSIEL